MSYKRKLTQVSLPPEVSNRGLARWKRIGHDHHSTLHLWWARRPIATPRALVFAQLADDRSSHLEAIFTDDAQNRERAPLIGNVGCLVDWGRNRSRALLKASRGEIVASRGSDKMGSDRMMVSNRFEGRFHSVQIAVAERAERVKIVMDVCAGNSSGFAEDLVRTVSENSRVVGFGASEFEDVEW